MSDYSREMPLVSFCGANLIPHSNVSNDWVLPILFAHLFNAKQIILCVGPLLADWAWRCRELCWQYKSKQMWGHAKCIQMWEPVKTGLSVSNPNCWLWQKAFDSTTRDLSLSPLEASPIANVVQGLRGKLLQPGWKVLGFWQKCQVLFRTEKGM